MKATKQMPYIVAVRKEFEMIAFSFATLRQAKAFMKEMDKLGVECAVAVSIKKKVKK